VASVHKLELETEALGKPANPSADHDRRNDELKLVDQACRERPRTSYMRRPYR
jgi:hypothetical protein